MSKLDLMSIQSADIAT